MWYSLRAGGSLPCNIVLSGKISCRHTRGTLYKSSQLFFNSVNWLRTNHLLWWLISTDKLMRSKIIKCTSLWAWLWDIILNRLNVEVRTIFYGWHHFLEWNLRSIPEERERELSKGIHHFPDLRHNVGGYFKLLFPWLLHHYRLYNAWVKVNPFFCKLLWSGYVITVTAELAETFQQPS